MRSGGERIQHNAAADVAKDEKKRAVGASYKKAGAKIPAAKGAPRACVRETERERQRGGCNVKWKPVIWSVCVAQRAKTGWMEGRDVTRTRVLQPKPPTGPPDHILHIRTGTENTSQMIKAEPASGREKKEREGERENTQKNGKTSARAVGVS